MSYYDAIAPGYNALYREEQLRKAMLIKENIRVKKTSLLLDVGCGTGVSSSVFDCRKIGIDPSIRLIRQAKMPAVKASAEKLPFGSGMFDFVICITAIHNFKSPEKGIIEMKRVAKQNGTAAISVLKKTSRFGEIEALIKKHFTIRKIVDEEKDVIYLCMPPKMAALSDK